MLNRTGNLSLSAAGLMAVVLSIFSGLAFPVPTQAQLIHPAEGKLPSFDAATIRSSQSGGAFVKYRVSSGRFTVESATLTALIQFAYSIKSADQLPAEPKWIGSLKFDIDAKVADTEGDAIDSELPDQKLDRYRLMMQSLLADRFKLKLSSRSRDISMYALAVAKNGPKLTPAKQPTDAKKHQSPALTVESTGELKAAAVSIAIFAEWLSGRAETGGRVVKDETGLNGAYDFTLNWTADDEHGAHFSGAGQGPGGSPSPDSAATSFLTALQEQLGLRLQSRRARVEVLVIDHVEQPSPN
jgi:uncharacterized protein (TIGR03435 family)